MHAAAFGVARRQTALVLRRLKEPSGSLLKEEANPELDLARVADLRVVAVIVAGIPKVDATRAGVARQPREVGIRRSDRAIGLEAETVDLVIPADDNVFGIEQIEEFGRELQARPVAHDLEALQNAEIHAVEAAVAEGVAQKRHAGGLVRPVVVIAVSVGVGASAG